MRTLFLTDWPTDAVSAAQKRWPGQTEAAPGVTHSAQAVRKHPKSANGFLDHWIKRPSAMNSGTEATQGFVHSIIQRLNWIWGIEFADWLVFTALENKA